MKNASVNPRVSILLPTYNVESYIKETLLSLLNQTFQDFEIIVVDDCSTDKTVERIAELNDKRIKLFVNGDNLGRAGSDNAGITHVRGEFVAKMDGDDICQPERLARQIAYLDDHPEVDVLGTWLQNFGASTYLHKYPVTPNELKVRTLFTLPGGNNTYMMRTKLFCIDGMHYDASLRQTEDYDFFVRYLDKLTVATIPEVLVKYRVLDSIVKKSILDERARVSTEIQKRLFVTWGLLVSDRELLIHSKITFLNGTLGDITPDEVEEWLLRIIAHNQSIAKFDRIALERGLGERWFEFCYAYLDNDTAIAYKQSVLCKMWKPSMYQLLKFSLKKIKKNH